MARLMPNPIGDLETHMRSIETAVRDLSGDLVGVQQLPAILGELQKLNKTNGALLKEVKELRQDLGRPR